MVSILHVGLGPLGQRIVGDLYRRGLGRVVAAVDSAEHMRGRVVSDIAEGCSDRVPIVSSLDEVDAWSAIDCAVVTTSSDLAACAPTFRALLARGCAVVSTCEELAFPWLRHGSLARELDALAIDTGGKLLGTGVNPGYLMDAFALATTTVCREVRAITVYRIQDATPRRLPFQRKIGVGLSLDEFARRIDDGSLRHVGLGESLHFLAHYLGLALDRWSEDIEPVIADTPLSSGLGPVAAGDARGVRQIARGYNGSALAIELVFHAAIGEPDPHDRVVVDGDPPIDLTWKGGVHGDIATSSIVLNSIRGLRAAAPGLHTMATLPLQGRAPRA